MISQVNVCVLDTVQRYVMFTCGGQYSTVGHMVF